MPRRFRVAFRVACGGITGAWALAACFDFGSLGGDGSSGTPLDAASIDGTSGDSGRIDAAFDAPFDAGLDPRFCLTNPGHTLCDDFDDDAWRVPWNQPDLLTPPSVIGLDPALSPYTPFSLAATSAPPDASVSAYSFLQTKFHTTPSLLHVAFDFELVEGGSSSVAVTNIVLAGQVGYALKLTQPVPPVFQIVEVTRPDAGGPFVYTTVPGVSHTVLPDVWNHVDLTFDLNGTDAGEIDVTFGSGTIVTVAPEPLPVEPAQPFSLQAGVGSFSGGPYSPAKVHIDNYVVDTN